MPNAQKIYIPHVEVTTTLNSWIYVSNCHSVQELNSMRLILFDKKGEALDVDLSSEQYGRIPPEFPWAKKLDMTVINNRDISFGWGLLIPDGSGELLVHVAIRSVNSGGNIDFKRSTEYTLNGGQPITAL